ncbi:hypothetical protein [Larkinella sp. C7]|uniref:hypothetical protein n=1 Tax=Larkinella sp. C7 TaxID=2576607 RepID=UPI00111129BB|nr:hypothetical protein [Larkinella sp. C7]
MFPNWQPTGNVRCDASTDYLQEREERDIAEGSLTYNVIHWVPTGEDCRLPTANWQTTGNTRCNPTVNRLEREERDMATGSVTYNETRWILTTDCCPMSAPTVNALPAAISGSQTVTLTASGCAFQVEWSGPGGTSTGVVLMVTLSQTTTFTARCLSGSCQSPTASVTVQRITVPAPIIRTNQTALCPGDTLQLDADGCEGLVRWSNGMTGNRIRFAPTATTTYSATCVVSNVASEASNAIGILVQTAPTGASATTGQTPYTTGQTISLSATAAGATRYEWSGPGGFMATGQSVSRPNATVGMGGSYTVRAYSGAACPAVATVSVTVQPSVTCTLAFDGEPLADCDFSAADTTRRGRITVKVKNEQVNSSLHIALYQPVVNGGQTSYQLKSILPNSPAVFTGLQEGTYRIEAYEVTGIDTCRAGSRLVSVVCDTTVSGCNIRIKAVNSQQTETDVLPRVGGVLQPLTLSVQHLEGAFLAGYTYQWTRTAGTGAAVSLGTTPTLSATAIGEYAVKLMSGTDTCTAYLTVRSKPCTPRTHTYACGTMPAIPLPDNGSRLSNLAPGDTIRAADFDIIVTEVRGGGSAGWNGVGYTEIPYLQGSRIAIELTGVVVNECYELVGGTAVSAYDPSGFSGQPGSVDKFSDLSKVVAEVYTLLENLKSTDANLVTEQKQRLSSLTSVIQADTSLTEVQKQQAIQQINAISEQLTIVEQQPCICASCSTSSTPGGRLAAAPNCQDIQIEIARSEVAYTEALGGSMPGCNAPKPTGTGRDGELKTTHGIVQSVKVGTVGIACTKTWIYIKKIGDIAVNEGWYETVDVVIDSLFRYGEVNPITLFMSGKQQLTRFTQWYIQDRINCQETGSCDNSFGKAAIYNTNRSNYRLYRPIDQISAYYNWAALEVQKKSSVRFFHAARDVTGWLGVRGAFTVPLASGLSEAGRKSLADVNVILLEKNMPIINQILTSGSSNIAQGNGIIWDFNYVLIEQRALTQYLFNNNYLPKADIYQINENFKDYEPFNPHFKLAKFLVNTARLDYQIEKHRFAIGRSLVFLRHADDPTFVNSPRYQQALDYLKTEYGNQNVEQFKQAFLGQ